MIPIVPFAGMVKRLLIAVAVLGAGIISTADAEDFGRFFTTPMQRQYLEQLKNRGAPIIVKIDEDLGATDKNTEKTKVDEDAVTIKGLVYRKNGKNAAWINNSNTYQGDFASGYTGAAENKITPSNVQVRIGNRSDDVTLKVGQKYEPATQNIIDISKTPPGNFSTKTK